MGKRYILSIDQGTSGTKTLIFDANGEVVAKATKSLKTHYGEDGFVEQNPEEIYANALASVKDCLTEFEKAGGDITKIASCGISNQRETFVVFDKNGKPLYNAVVWQCKRSIAICNQLKSDGLEPLITERTGLIIDPYFSGTKLVWLYQNVEKVKHAIDAGEAYFGTVDTWLLYKLTNGEQYLTDHTNASRTLFFNLKTLSWDQEILTALGLANLNLPKIKPSSADYGLTTINGLFNEPLKVSAMIGDSHAAAFGEGCFSSGTAKATLGTGCSVLMNIGESPKVSNKGMMTTICWSMEGRVDYALEGVIVSCGSTIEWLKNELGLFKNSIETETMAQAVSNNNGVYLIPAFSGLGAPYWDMNRKAEIVGLNFNCNRNHIVRAALESVAFQLKDVILAMEEDAGVTLSMLMVNGGMSANQFLIQLISDTLQCTIGKGNNPDVSALGAGLLAGLHVGVYPDLDSISQIRSNFRSFKPDESASEKYHQEWLGYVNS
ncbi:FGGY family carbohydrate kinase [Pedobacter alpinus]|uniref:ATP:glycerol 3-phosphotransferase n=1 Tax=Pedobacter alpinus TaxID=1590643 RepID=A0ABW5TS43_9SPHI